MLKKAVFTISEFPKAYIGYTSGRLWNGWATPFFEYAEAIKIAEGFNECAEYEMQYDKTYDQFYILDTESGELEKWQGQDYTTAEGIKHLYGIGAYCWIWDEENVISTATSIRNLLLDFDIDVDRKSIYDKLNDFNKFREAIEILRADEKAEIKIQKLRKELTIMEIGQIIAVNGNLFEYGGIEDAEYAKGIQFHKVYEIDVDEDGILTAIGSTWYFNEEELAKNTIEFTKDQWYGIVKYFICQDYEHLNLTEEEIIDATEDIVGREFAYGRPKTIEELQKHIATYLNR